MTSENQKIGAASVSRGEPFVMSLWVEGAISPLVIQMPPDLAEGLATDILGDQTQQPMEIKGWYWCERDPLHEQQALNGPFATKCEATIAAPEGAHIGLFARPAIDCDTFSARDIFEAMERLNFEAIVPSQPVQWPSGAEEEQLERELAAVLFRFLDARKLWNHFNALEEITPSEGEDL